MPPLSSRRPSQLRSAALLAIAAAVPVLVFGGVSALVVFQRQQSELRSQAVDDARHLSELIDRELVADVDAAEALAALPVLDPPQDLATFQEVARREMVRHPDWRTVILLDPQGRRLTNSREPARLGPALDPGSIAAAAAGRSVVGAIAKGPDAFAIPVRAPVIRDGKVSAIVTIAAQPDAFASVLAAAHTSPDWIVVVIDDAGRVVARTHNSGAFLGVRASAAALQARATGQSGIYDGYTLDGVQTVSAYWKSPAFGWSVHIGIPRAAFEAPLRRQIAYTGFGFALSLLLAALFLSLLLRELRLRRDEAAAQEQSHRLEALGRLTGGVAHDFNNLLMIIQGNAETLQRRLKVEAAERPLAAIRDATARAAKLARELLIFARGGQAETTVLDLSTILAEFIGELRQAVGERVEISADLDPQAGAIDVDRVQLELAVLNLAVNARDAMPGGGSLSIATRRLDDGRVQLTVADNGAGIPEAIRSRVFEPFFTTKPAGAGTGLGLTQVYGFVRHAGGGVGLDSKVGRGAAFTLTFPPARRAAPAIPVADAVAPLAANSLAGRRILLLDDNSDIRDLTAGFLRDEGATVEAFADAAGALTVLEAGRSFDAVVSDIVMPGELDGLGLAEAVRQRSPDLPILLVSGYSASLADAAARGFPVLRKPYPLADLAAALCGVLHRPAEPAGGGVETIPTRAR